MKRLLYVIAWLVYVSSFAAESTCANAVDLRPEEILERYEQSLKPINSRVAFSVESLTTYAGAWDPKRMPVKRVGTVYRDGDKLCSEFRSTLVEFKSA